MSRSNFLRHLAVHPDPPVQAVLRENTNHLCWMYEHYALPCPSDGVAKVNVWFTPEPQHSSGPTECLGIADVRTYFDVASYPSLLGEEQQRYYLDRLHAGLLDCARRFDWDPTGLEHARGRMLGDELRFAFYWKKPLSGPDRLTKVQGFIEAGPRTHVGLVFTDQSGVEICRSLLSVMSTGSFDLRYIFGQMVWMDERTVRVTQSNGRDYWLCTSSGGVEFHYPRAEKGDAAGEYALGRMYYEGTTVLEDREQGVRLLQSAASKGDGHAQAFLRRLQSGAWPARKASHEGA